MSRIVHTAKYLVIKRCPDDNSMYSVVLSNDRELALHIAATFKTTGHEIISVTNLKQEPKP
jgi:hypothetical protein